MQLFETILTVNIVLAIVCKCTGVKSENNIKYMKILDRMCNKKNKQSREIANIGYTRRRTTEQSTT